MEEQQIKVEFNSTPQVSLDVFIPELNLIFTGLSKDVLKHYLIRVINRLAITHNILYRTSIIDTRPLVTHYKIIHEDDVKILSIISIKQLYNTCGIPIIRDLSEPKVHDRVGIHTWFTAPDIISFYPSIKNSYEILYSVILSEHACMVDELLYTYYFDSIIAGVKSMIYRLPDKPWTNLNLAFTEEEYFRRSANSTSTVIMMRSRPGGFKMNYPKV